VVGKYKKKYNTLKTVALGFSKIMKGLKSFDIGGVIEGAKKIGPVLLNEMKDKGWFKTIDLMKSLA